MNSLIQNAQNFAHAAHDSIGQVRKYSGQPYWTHTDNVAYLVSQYTQDEEVIAAAHLHDYLEDVNPNGFSLLVETFGTRVAQIVLDLTDFYTKEAFPQFNRNKRKQLEAVRLGAVRDESKLIKLADLIDNTKDIARQDPGFAALYLREKAAVLPNLKVASPIWDVANAQVVSLI